MKKKQKKICVALGMGMAMGMFIVKNDEGVNKFTPNVNLKQNEGIKK